MVVSDDDEGSRCAICLCAIATRALLDQCFHEFCFACVSQWAEVSRACPLCKTAFKNVIYDIVSDVDYKLTDLPVKPERSDSTRSQAPAVVIGHRYRTTHLVGTSRRHGNGRSGQHSVQWGSTDGSNRHGSGVGSDIFQMRREMVASAASRYHSPRLVASKEMRRLVYALKLRYRHVGANSHTRVRNLTPAFYAAHPHHLSRLEPFIIRDLQVLLQASNVDLVTTLTMSLLERFDIQSEEFETHLRPFLFDNTTQFTHELFGFMRSPYDMVGYDNSVQYNTVDNTPFNANAYYAQTIRQAHTQGSTSQAQTSVGPTVRGIGNGASDVDTGVNPSNGAPGSHRDVRTSVTDPAMGSSELESQTQILRSRQLTQMHPYGIVRGETEPATEANQDATAQDTATTDVQETVVMRTSTSTQPPVYANADADHSASIRLQGRREGRSYARSHTRRLVRSSSGDESPHAARRRAQKDKTKLDRRRKRRDKGKPASEHVHISDHNDQAGNIAYPEDNYSQIESVVVSPGWSPTPVLAEGESVVAANKPKRARLTTRWGADSTKIRPAQDKCTQQKSQVGAVGQARADHNKRVAYSRCRATRSRTPLETRSSSVSSPGGSCASDSSYYSKMRSNSDNRSGKGRQKARYTHSRGRRRSGRDGSRSRSRNRERYRSDRSSSRDSDGCRCERSNRASYISRGRNYNSHTRRRRTRSVDKAQDENNRGRNYSDSDRRRSGSRRSRSPTRASSNSRNKRGRRDKDNKDDLRSVRDGKKSMIKGKAESTTRSRCRNGSDDMHEVKVLKGGKVAGINKLDHAVLHNELNIDGEDESAGRSEASKSGTADTQRDSYTLNFGDAVESGVSTEKPIAAVSVSRKHGTNAGSCAVADEALNQTAEEIMRTNNTVSTPSTSNATLTPLISGKEYTDRSGCKRSSTDAATVADHQRRRLRALQQQLVPSARPYSHRTRTDKPVEKRAISVQGELAQLDVSNAGEARSVEDVSKELDVDEPIRIRVKLHEPEAEAPPTDLGIDGHTQETPQHAQGDHLLPTLPSNAKNVPSTQLIGDKLEGRDVSEIAILGRNTKAESGEHSSGASLTDSGKGKAPIKDLIAVDTNLNDTTPAEAISTSQDLKTITIKPSLERVSQLRQELRSVDIALDANSAAIRRAVSVAEKHACMALRQRMMTRREVLVGTLRRAKGQKIKT